MEYNKELIKKLLEDNPDLNNVEIGKLYNEEVGIDIPMENIRKCVANIRGKEEPPYVSSNGDLNQKKVNLDKGTLESHVDTTFEPKDDISLAKLHKIDLTKYKISSYWSKLKSNGKFTSSVFCTLRKITDSLTLEEIKDALQSSLFKNKTIPAHNISKLPVKSDKALIVWVSDEHVGASVKNELYENEWNKSEYFKRKSKVIDVVKEQGDIYGSFDKIIVCTLGDTMDGYNGQTTRGGHSLAQNMTNKEAIKTYVDVNKYVWDGIVDLRKTDTYNLYNIENSNHGGLGWDAAANLGLEMYLKTKYPTFEVNAIEKVIGSFSYGINDFHLAHGKDDTHMKRNYPLHIDAKLEGYIKEYLDENGFKDKTRPQHFVKGDLHQFATQQGRFFTYTNIPSLFGSSGWVMSNIGKGKAGFCYSVVDKNSSEFTYTPVWF
jgi:hypothetical protein